MCTAEHHRAHAVVLRHIDGLALQQSRLSAIAFYEDRTPAGQLPRRLLSSHWHYLPVAGFLHRTYQHA